MRTVLFHAEAFRDYTDWAARDPKLSERLTRLKEQEVKLAGRWD